MAGIWAAWRIRRDRPPGYAGFMLRTILSLLSAAALAIAFLGCGRDPASDAATSVSASTTQLADIARNVAGHRAEVAGILAANSDPHDYEPQPSDAEELLDADLVLQSGGDVDAWLDELVESSGSAAPKLVVLDRIGMADGDPHWWQDLSAAVAAVEAIRDELVGVDPDGADTYEANAAAYIGRLNALDREITACMERLPPADRLLVTSHDALGLYAERYRIEVIGATIPALTTQAQPSAGETAELVDLIRARGVTTVFPEAGVSQELETAIAMEAGATVGGELWADTLGPEDSDGATYLEALAANTEQLMDGFSGGAERCEIDVGPVAAP